jgi:hypothetical protein
LIPKIPQIPPSVPEGHAAKPSAHYDYWANTEFSFVGFGRIDFHYNSTKHYCGQSLEHFLAFASQRLLCGRQVLEKISKIER